MAYLSLLRWSHAFRSDQFANIIYSSESESTPGILSICLMIILLSLHLAREGVHQQLSQGIRVVLTTVIESSSILLNIRSIPYILLVCSRRYIPFPDCHTKTLQCKLSPCLMFPTISKGPLLSVSHGHSMQNMIFKMTEKCPKNLKKHIN